MQSPGHSNMCSSLALAVLNDGPLAMIAILSIKPSTSLPFSCLHCLKCQQYRRERLVLKGDIPG